KALEALQQALQIAVNTKSRPRQAGALNNIAQVYNAQGQYPKALDYYQQSLALAKEIHAPDLEATALNNIGQLYADLGNYTEALTFLQQSSELSQKLGVSNSVDLSNIANVYFAQGRNAQALEKLQQALNLAQTSGDRAQESLVLRNMVAVYESQANYAKALEVQQQALKIQQEIGARPLEIGSLIQLGRLYHDLGDYNKALEFHQQALNLSREIGSRLNEMFAIGNMGRAYLYQKQYNKALESYQQSLNIARESGDVRSESNYLFSIGRVYEKQGQSEQAIANNQQALNIARQIGARSLEGLILNSVGAAYANQGKSSEALTTLQQALAIHRQVQAPEAEAEALAKIGKVLAQTNQPELAIIWYKQSVNTYEAIRGNLRGLPQKQQQSYGETIADTYRELAKLLLQQDRVLEAQEVLDLLKLQELEDYLRNVRGNALTQQGLEFWQAEQQILNLYDQWIKQNFNSNANFEAFVKSPDVTALVQQLQRTARGQNLNPEQLARLQDNLQSIDHAALLYPLILDDRLELVLVTPNSLVRKTVKVDRVQLNQAIANFRSDLTDPSSNPLPDAQQLYQWLIQPLEADLQQAQIHTLLYAADGQLRYIPLAALHDGKQWLIQRFTVDNITAASLTNFNRQDNRPLQVLAAAYSNPKLSYQVPIGKEKLDFNGLKFAGIEVETIAKEVPNTTTFFNKNFSRANIEPRLDQYSIVHFATHAEFVSGAPNQSFILFGSGERVTLADIDRWKLPHVDLVVLSACQTAASGKLGNGEEILGFGYQIQRTGAEAAIASLWSVSDGGTQALMDAFYTGLQTGKTSKAEALRQAQIALITGNYKALGDRRGLRVEQRINTNVSSQVSNRLSHPYYWAPFILIGNGL
ncbi:MAG TPA: tetratricopeptide repeat protein, partial [Allocoleopsis sp.]